jgi:uncharacterized protein (DUF58 family)
MELSEAPTRQTRFGLGPAGPIYCVVLALLAGVAAWSGVNLVYWALGLMIGALVVSLVLQGLMMRGLDVERLLPGHGVAGEMTVLRYRVHNGRTWVPVLGLTILESWGAGRGAGREVRPVAETPPRLRGRPHGWVLHLPPHEATQAEAPCWPLRRGLLSFDRVVLRSAFPFGIVRRDVTLKRPARLLVYPHLFRVHRRLLQRMARMEPLGRRQLKRAGGTEEFFGLRAYRPGDPLRLIDWKRSAKTGDLVCREMTQPSPPRIMLALDLCDVPGEAAYTEVVRGAVESAVSLAASVVCHAYFRGYQIGLVVYGAAAPVMPLYHSLPHRTRILEVLSHLDPHRPPTDAAAPPLQPSVVVRPWGEDSPDGVQPMALSAARMDRYVSDPQGGSSRLLGRRAPTGERRAARKDPVST